MTNNDQNSIVDRQLATLRDSPVNNDGASDVVLSSIFTYLMGVPVNASDGRLHWFCNRASSTTVAAATFLIRYFGAFSADILAGFYQSFEAWELSTVLEDITGQSLASTSPAIGYRIVSNLTILQDARIMSIIHSDPPSASIDSWPSDPIPPGILILLMDEESEVRKWAENQVSLSRVIPIPQDRFSPSHIIAFDAAIKALDPVPVSAAPFSFARDQQILWSGFWTVLKLVPVEYLQTGIIYRAVKAHLHDIGPLQIFDISYVASTILPVASHHRSG
ncbi:hypothetical protein B0H13DRAFT_1854272 [Mycena leptocephala]|nr:hypothetical protein B0H13DRAFT_1854272 [Mycena leptocephala]